MFRKIVEGSAYLFVGVLVVKFLAIIYTFMLARMLGPTGMGMLSLALLIGTWISVVALLSIQTVSTQLISEYQEKKLDISPLVTAALVIGFISGTIGALINLFLAKHIAVTVFHNSALTKYISLASLIILGAVLYNAILGVERGLKKFGRYALIDSSRQMIIVVIGFVFLVILGFRVGGAIWAAILSPFLVIIIMLFRYRQYFTFKFGKEIKRFLSLSGWLTFLGLLLALFMSLDKFFLGSILSTESVGFYVPAITIITFLGLFLPSSVKNAALPFIVESYAGKRIYQTKQYLQKTLRYYLSIVGYLLIIGMFFKNEIVYLIFGSQYLPTSAEILGILLFSAIFFAIYIILHSFIIGIGKAKEASFIVIAAIILAIITYLIFVGMFGLIGAAIATVVNIFILAMMYLYQVSAIIKPNLKKIAILILIINLFLVLASKLSSDFATNILFAAILMGGYSLVIFGLRCLTRKDIVFIIDKFKSSIKSK